MNKQWKREEGVPRWKPWQVHVSNVTKILTSCCLSKSLTIYQTVDGISTRFLRCSISHNKFCKIIFRSSSSLSSTETVICSSSMDMETIDGKDPFNRRNDAPEASIQRSSVPLVRVSEKRMQMQASMNPEATAEFLLDNSKLFYQKLREFHEKCGLSLVASVASTVLDLFMLYREVTIRGGFAMVTKYERWAEVVSALSFTTRVPDPSFQLQDLYANLLYRFELIYFSGDLGLQDTPSGLAAPCSLAGNISNVHSSTPRECSMVNNMQKTPCQSSGEKLNGAMNRVEDSAGEQFPTVRCLKNGGGLKASNADPVAPQVRAVSGKIEPTFQSSLNKEGSEKPTVGSKTAVASKPTKGSSIKATKKKDPDAPMSIRTGYHFFLCKECERLKKIHGRSLGPNLRKMVIDSWKTLSDSDRLPYIEESRKDKVRFDREMVAYNERQNMQNGKARGNKHKPESSGIGNEQCTIGKPGPGGIEMVTHGGHQNIQNDNGQCTIVKPGSGVQVVPHRGHQNMQMGNRNHEVPYPESNGVEKVAHEEHANIHIGNGQFKCPKPKRGGVEQFAYEDYQNMLIGGPRYNTNSEPSSGEIPHIDVEQYEIHNSEQSGFEMLVQEDHQNVHIEKMQCKNNGPEPCGLVMEAHNPTEVGEAQCEIHNPEPERVGVPQKMQISRADEAQCEIHNPEPERVDVPQEMQISRADRISDPGNSWSPQTKETINAHLDDHYCVRLRMEHMDEINKLRKPDQSMVQFAVELMENAERLDASLQIQLGDFLSVP